MYNRIDFAKLRKKHSLLGLVLIGVSALTAAIIPSKPQYAVAQDPNPNNGHAIQSTLNGIQTPTVPATVTEHVGGVRSYTKTGAPCDGADGLSATSVSGNECTVTIEKGHLLIIRLQKRIWRMTWNFHKRILD
ncbi:hypothetical protein AAHN97_26855 [Chitinophaga niabensis]|uniref:hypothetical protein n=1 Tax=Chitinophaga niabensis TaxID=536979 RepID=UPI0031BB5F5F